MNVRKRCDKEILLEATAGLRKVINNLKESFDRNDRKRYTRRDEESELR